MFLHPELGSDPPIRLGRESGLTPRARAPARHSERPRAILRARAQQASPAPLHASVCAPNACASSACALARPCACSQPLPHVFFYFQLLENTKILYLFFFLIFFFSYPSVAFLATSTCNSLNTASIQLNNFMSLTLKFIKILFHYPITQIILL